MKLLIVSQYYKPELLPINYVVSLLRENGYDVEVLTAKPNYPSGKFFEGYSFFSKIVNELDGIKVYRMPIIPRGKNHGAVGLSLNYMSFVISASLIAPFLLWKKDYELIFVYGLSPITKALPALLLGKIKKVPVILWVQDLWPESINSTSYSLPKVLIKIIRSIVRYIYNQVDLILVTSSGFISKIVSDFNIPNHKTRHLPNTIDKIFLSPNITEKNISDNLKSFKSKFNILFTGNVGSAQSIETVINAALILKRKKIDNINYLIVGSGSKLEDHRDKIKTECLDNIHFLGQYPLEDMPGFIRFADVLLITLTKEEVFNLTVPNKMQSYLASNKPVLGSLSGAGADLIKKVGCGLASEAEDAESLATNSIRMSEMSISELKEMSHKGLSFFKENYSDDVFLLNLKEYIDLVTKN